MTTKKITVGYFGFKKLDSGKGKVLIKASNNKWYSSTLFKDVEAAKEFASAFPKPRKGDKIKMALAEPNEKGYSDIEGWTLDENAPPIEEEYNKTRKGAEKARPNLREPKPTINMALLPETIKERGEIYTACRKFMVKEWQTKKESYMADSLTACVNTFFMDVTMQLFHKSKGG